MIKQRNLFLVLLFTFITLGIYLLVMIANITNETNDRDQSGWKPSGGMAVFLSIITFGIYAIYWYIRMAIRLKDIHNDVTPMILIIVFLFVFPPVALLVLVHYVNLAGKTTGANQIA